MEIKVLSARKLFAASIYIWKDILGDMPIWEVTNLVNLRLRASNADIKNVIFGIFMHCQEK